MVVVVVVVFAQVLYLVELLGVVVVAVGMDSSCLVGPFLGVPFLVGPLEERDEIR